MVTGASTASLAIVLADAKRGLTTQGPLVAEPYRANRHTGGFILADDATHHTVAGGMIEEPHRG